MCLSMIISSRSFNMSAIGLGDLMSPSGGRRHIFITFSRARCKNLKLFIKVLIFFTKDVLTD